MGLTLYDKLWDSHVVHLEEDGTALLYIDRHLVHEVTSPQAYEGLKVAGRKPWRVDSVVATADHNTPTTGWDEGVEGIRDPFAKLQIQTLDANIRHFGAKVYFPFLDQRQGIVHVIGPEQGATLPGMTVVCGDSHTSTHGAFACLAHGIGTSEVEHVLATQCLVTRKMKNMRVSVEGALARGVTAKDVVLAIIGRIGTAGGTGHAIEVAGSTIRALSMEGRMTICNMSIEAAARAEGRRRGAGGVVLAHAEERPGRQIRSPGHARRARDQAARHLGHLARDGDHRGRRGARPRPRKRRREARRHGTRARLHGAQAEYADHRYQARQGIHRLVHQLAPRGPSRRRRRRAGQARRVERASCDGGPRLRAGEGPGRARGAGPRLSRRRLRVARAWLLDVPRHESRSARSGRALRVDLQSQFRRTPGRRRSHPSCQPGDGRGCRDRRAFRRRAAVALS